MFSDIDFVEIFQDGLCHILNHVISKVNSQITKSYGLQRKVGKKGPEFQVYAADETWYWLKPRFSV